MLAALVGLWLLAAAYLVVDGAVSLGHGGSQLRHVRDQATISALTEPSTLDALSRSRASFDHAARRFDNPLLAPIRILPVASRHLAAARRLAHASQQGSTVADTTLRGLDRLVDQPHATGPQRITVLRDLAALAGRARSGLRDIDVGSGAHLASALGNAVDDVAAQQADAVQGAQRLQEVSTSLATVLAGPKPYLLLGANNAEMRNDSGMFLSAATLSLHGGQVQLGAVHPTATTVLAEGAVPVSGDLARNWSWLDPGRDLRNLGLTADFPQSARLAVANWAKVPGGAPTAGAIVIDVDGIRALLRVVGPVTVDGIRYTPDTVRGLLLRDQYRTFGGDRDQRRDQLGRVASVIFTELQQGHWKLDSLATNLSDAVESRHLLIWSVDPAVERAWHDVGADGHLTDRSLSVGLLNRAGEKLDSWIDTAADLTSADAGDGTHRLVIRYRITNRAPGRGPAYLVGPNVAGLHAGDHRALLVANLPRGASDVKISGATPFLSGTDGPTVTIGGEVTVRRGQAVVVTVTAVLPRSVTELVLEPSARILHTDWSFDGHAFDRDRRRTVSLTP